MTERVHDPAYWRSRFNDALRGGPDVMHTAVFRCPLQRWRQIEEKHRQILARHVKDGDSVLDLACGWGRLVFLLPDRTQWQGPYMGVDLSPDFISYALTHTIPAAVASRRGGCAFAVCDLLKLSAKVPLLQERVTCKTCKGTGWKPTQCNVCMAEPDEEGYTNHGRGCYVLDADGGGSELADSCETCNGARTILFPRKWDWGVLVSVRPMIIRNQGQETWDRMEAECRKVCKKLLYLEYDPECEGFVE